MDRSRHAVVLGAGLTGTLAAAALAPHADKVTVIDRDILPAGPVPRRGTPQARHAHLMWAGGARAIEDLLPGTAQRLAAAGAHTIGIPSGIVTYTAQGWMRRWPQTQHLITCSRDLLDWVLRERLLEDDRISLRQDVEVLGLCGDHRRITGVRVRNGSDELTIEADMVVDATGRGSRAPQWLKQAGLPAVAEEEVDSGLAYVTRIYRAPAAAVRGFPLVNVQADPSQPRPGQTATLLPIENGLWLVTLSGTRGGEPPSDENLFVDFAKSVRHPIVGDLIAAAEPVGPTYSSRSTVNRRRFFEKSPAWPRGFIALGDAVATYNPVYGQGMSVAAQSAIALRNNLNATTLAAADTRRIQRAIGRVVDTPWLVATGQDLMYPGATGKPQPAAAKLVQLYVERLIRTATGRPAAAKALFDAFTLSAPMQRLVSPAAILAVLLGPGRAGLDEPPLTPEELANALAQPNAPA